MFTKVLEKDNKIINNKLLRIIIFYIKLENKLLKIRLYVK